MIYISVGTFHYGFDRLIKIIDEINKEKKLKCFAQIGNGKYVPKYMKYTNFLNNKKHLNYIKKSRIIIAHGGMGIISEVINENKPLIVFPRTKQEAGHDQSVAISKLKKKINLCICNTKFELKKNISYYLKNKKISKYKLSRSDIPLIIKGYIKEIEYE